MKERKHEYELSPFRIVAYKNMLSLYPSNSSEAIMSRKYSTPEEAEKRAQMLFLSFKRIQRNASDGISIWTLIKWRIEDFFTRLRFKLER